MAKRLALILPLTAILYASCCKMICADEGLVVDYQKFTVSQADTVLYVRYKPGTTDPLDSNWKYLELAASVPPTAPSTFTEQLQLGYDWQIYLPALDRRYRFTNFQLERDKCSCEPGRYTVLRGYAVNNTPKQGNYLVLE